MNDKFNSLHSHSGIERELKFPKHLVLVDEKYQSLFFQDTIAPFKHNGRLYYKVPVLSFVRKGGVFKNFLE